MKKVDKENIPEGSYKENWDQYYKSTYGRHNKKALWDVDSELAIEEDFVIFSKHFNNDLSIIDLGCGTGTQSVFLSKHYPQVLGVDVSAEAIEIANNSINLKNIAFDTLDVTDVEKAIEIHERIGDANIYMRGVLHQIVEKDIVNFQKTIKILMGKSGMMFCIEVSDRIREYFDNSKDDFSKLPKRMQQVFISNLPPKGLSQSNIKKYFPGDMFKIELSGSAKLNTNIQFSSEEAIYIPAEHVLLKPKFIK